MNSISALAASDLLRQASGFDRLEWPRCFMTSAGVTLIWRVVLVIAAIIATASLRALVGPSKRRSLYMGVGTSAGMAAGVAASSLLFSWVRIELSPAIFAFVGMIAGWGVAWLFARHVPREAS